MGILAKIITIITITMAIITGTVHSMLTGYA
jgi:hypothetical protein